MRSGIAFSEDYLDPAAEVRLLEQAIGWAPAARPGRARHHVRLPADAAGQRAPHGGPFEYRSCETDVLGWVCEAAAGDPDARADVRSCCGAGSGAEFDANIGVDSVGTGMFDGGISRRAARPGPVRRA